MNKLTEALTNANIPVPSKDTETFKIVRWGRNNRYWLKKFDGGYVFGDFVTGLNDHVFEQNLKGEKLKNAKICLIRAYSNVEPLALTVNKRAATVAQNLLRSCRHSATNHAYLAKKNIFSHGLMEYKGTIVIPAYDANGTLWTLQFIDTEGKKRFLNGGKKKGCFFPLGSLARAERVFICEGYATGATVYETMNESVVVAFDSGNLKPVAQALREKHSNIKIIICADNDCYHETGINPGLEKAKEAALDTKAAVVYPTFKDSSTHPTDFNDLLILEGRETVKEQLDVAIKKANDSGIPDGFVLSDEGLFCLDKKQSTTKISNYIKVIAFTKNNDEVSRLVEVQGLQKQHAENLDQAKDVYKRW